MAEYEGPVDQPASQPGPIFTNSDGTPVKFHIQKNLPDHIIEYLEQLIKDNGGTVTDEIPWRGYVLVDPRTTKGQRFQEKHTRPDRPYRHVVCYTFVAASITKGEMLDPAKMQDVIPIFEDEDGPIKIYLGLPTGASRTRALKKLITVGETIRSYDAFELTASQLHGGQVVERGREAKVVIGDPNQPNFRQLDKYRDPPHKYLEPLSWVKGCIEARGYSHNAVILQPAMPKQAGRKPGSLRNDYTQEDDRHLVQYIASRCPTLAGRSGNKIYKDLCEQPDTYGWSKAHTWQSWRNRYYKDMARFNAAIARHLEAGHLRFPAPPGRQPQGQADDDEDRDQLEYEEPEDQEDALPPRAASKRPAPQDEDSGGHSESETDHERAAAHKRPRKDPQTKPDNNLDAEQMMFEYLGLQPAENSHTISPGDTSHPSTALASSTTRVSNGTRASPSKSAGRSSGGTNSTSEKSRGKMKVVQSEDSPPVQAKGVEPAKRVEPRVSAEPVRPTRVTRQNSAQPQPIPQTRPAAHATKRPARAATKRTGDKAKVVPASSTKKPTKKQAPAVQLSVPQQNSSGSSRVSDVSADALATEELLILDPAEEQDEEQPNEMVRDTPQRAEDETASSSEESDSEPEILSMDTQQFMKHDLRQRPKRGVFGL